MASHQMPGHEMKEIEVKIIAINKEDIINKIIALGATKTFEGNIHSISYNFPPNENISLLRLRKKGDKNYLTAKKSLSKEHARIAEETELEIESFEAMHTILTSLGYTIKKESHKKRTSYTLNETHFEIDEFTGIPAYMEIESSSEKKIDQFIRELGINPANVKNWNETELLQHYGKL
ncbi:MAG: class IV adenylate cyclase [Nanoarchaeota archaeon]|nr:class IV adenylate cyclase [Nanoarchaeota archaeon]